MEKYKLIKKLPFENSPKLGYISKPSHLRESLHYWMGMWFNPKNYPEYWEKVVEKEYEILSLVSKVNLMLLTKGAIVHLVGDKYKGTSKSGLIIEFDKDNYNKDNWDIHSVKRLSDGTVLSTGDYVKDYNSVVQPFKITSFKQTTNDKGNADILVTGERRGTYLINYNCQKVVRQPLFTTTDGVDIFEGDMVTPVNLDTLKIHATTPIRTGESLKYGNYKHFSTRESAEKYILENKPFLSIKDVIDAYMSAREESKSRNYYTELVNKVKNKI